MTFVLLALALFSFLQSEVAPVPQGDRATLTGGGDAAISREGDMLLVTVAGPRPGLASLCVGDGSRVRILHASAAVGEAVYVREGIAWRLKSGFDWKLRDSRTGGPTDEEVLGFLSRAGWVANAIRTGVGERRFRIRLTEQTRFLAITYLSTAEPMAVSYWPATVDDGCAAMKVAQGFLPETVRFQPERWHELAR